MSPRRSPSPRIAGRQDGFILVTSLIFLVILTLLAVSAINSSTLQQRMAANQREKSRALNAAESALRHVETVLASNDFRECNPVMNPIISGSSTPSGCDTSAADLIVIAKDSNAVDSAAHFFSDTFWSQTGVATYKFPGASNSSGLNVLYVIEYVRKKADDLDPGAVGNSVLFRITARARGRSPASRAVVQSYYQVTI